MNRKMASLASGVVLLVLLGMSPLASADDITWTLSGVTFGDGTSVSGSLVFDATTDTLVSANVITTGCPTCIFTTGETYTMADPAFAPLPFSIVLVPTGPVSTGTMLFDFELDLPGLTNSGGAVGLLAGVAFEGECGDDACDIPADFPFRYVTGGELVAPVVPSPEPSTLLLMGLGLLGLVVATKRLALP